MLESLSGLIELAGLEDEATLTVALSSAEPPVTTGIMLLLLDDADGLPRALRHYPGEHGVRVVAKDDLIRRSTVGQLLNGDAAGISAVIADPIDLFDVRDAPDGVRGVMDRLRDPVDGCPWDNAQTHESLRPHLLEETYEVLEAIAAGDPAELCEELGDLMMQVVLHAKLAEQAGNSRSTTSRRAFAPSWSGATHTSSATARPIRRSWSKARGNG